MSLENQLQKRMSATGLVFHGWATPEDSLTPEVTWSRVARLDVQPREIHSCVDEAARQYLAEAWMTHAYALGLIDDNGTFLLSIGGMAKLPWAISSIGGPLDVSQLGSIDNEPEFITRGISGPRICAITTEENGIWLIEL